MDVIVTGLPRSGATLAAALIDGLPNAVCLNSPHWKPDTVIHAPDIIHLCKLLTGDYAWKRAQLADKQPIEDFRAANSTPLTDGLHDPKMPVDSSGGQMAIPFTRPGLSSGFILGTKHHSFYTSLLPELVKFRHFKIIAVIRNPLDTFAAWQKLPQPLLSKGNPPGIARFWPEALNAASNADNTIAFAQLYDVYLKRYHELQEHVHIVKYEDIIDDPAIISRLFGIKVTSTNEHLVEARPRRQFQSSDTDKYREAIKRYGIYTKMYYKD